MNRRHCLAGWLPLLLILLSGAAVRVQAFDLPVRLVKDIGPGPDDALLSSAVNVNGVLFFSAADGVSGRELWKSDGTAAGTVMVKDIRPGALGSNPASLTNVDGSLFFQADRRRGRGRALEERRDRRRHRTGQGHLPRSASTRTPPS